MSADIGNMYGDNYTERIKEKTFSVLRMQNCNCFLTADFVDFLILGIEAAEAV